MKYVDRLCVILSLLAVTDSAESIYAQNRVDGNEVRYDNSVHGKNSDRIGHTHDAVMSVREKKQKLKIAASNKDSIYFSSESIMVPARGRSAYSDCGDSWAETYDLTFRNSIDKNGIFDAGKELIYPTDLQYHEFDTTITINGGHPIKFSRGKLPLSLYVSVCKDIMLPECGKEGKCEVILTSMGYNAADIELRVRGYDGSEAEVADVRSTGVHRDSLWCETRVIMDLKDDPKMLRVNVDYAGDTTAVQNLWLGGIAVRIDGEDIGEWDFRERLAEVPPTLDPNYILPLDRHGSISSLKQDLAGCRVVGLGHGIRGSRSLQQAEYDFCKMLIDKCDCRFIVLESGMNSLLWDLYVQGIGGYADEYAGLRRVPSNKLLDADALHAFMDWIRAFNSKRKESERVHVVSLSGTASPIELTHYFSTVLGEKRGARYMVCAYDKRYDELLETLQGDNHLSKKLGRVSYDILFSAVKYAAQPQSAFSPAEIEKQYDDRVLRNISDLDAMSDDDGPVAIIADGNEISYFDLLQLSPFEPSGLWKESYERELGRDGLEAKKNNMSRTLGQDLRARFGDAYMGICFVAGTGECLSYGSEPFADPRIMQLEEAPATSLESAAMRATGGGTFYYPAHAVGDGIHMLSCSAERGPRYMLRDVKRRFGAYVFVSESVAADLTYKDARAENPLKNNDRDMREMKTTIARLREELK